MVFVKFYIGDWEKATKYLSAEEKGVYIDLLMLYYSQCERISERICERIRNAYTESERKALDYVLSKFFVKEGEFYVNARCEEEISKQREKSVKAQMSAISRWSERNANAYANAYPNASETHMPTQCERNASQSQSQSQNIKKEVVVEKRTNTHELTLEAIPDSWTALCRANRPDLDPTKVFNSFRFYWTEGAGSSKRERFKSDRGWSQAWSNWIAREKQGTGSSSDSYPKVLSRDDPHFGLTPEQIEKRLEGSRRYHERIVKWEEEQRKARQQNSETPPDWFSDVVKETQYA